MAVGAHYGYSRSRRDPSVRSFLYGTKQHSDIINLESTAEQLETALEFLKTVKQSGRSILFVGTKPEARDLTRAAAESVGQHYAEVRWVGGTLTNWPQIKSRVDMLVDLRQKQESDTLVYKTKKEKLMLERKIEKLTKQFSGLVGMTDAIGAIVIIDARTEANAIVEASKRGIPVVALANTDCDITRVSYPIVANDANRASIKFFLDAMVASLQA